MKRSMMIAEYIDQCVPDYLMVRFRDEMRKWDEGATLGTYYQVGVLEMILTHAREAYEQGARYGR